MPLLRRSAFCCLLLAVAFCWARPVAVLAEGAPDPAAGGETPDLVSLYFSDDLLVESATRAPQPITQVAENVTIIDRDEIEAMNAHSVAEILSRVPGVFIAFNGGDFLSTANLNIQGSETRQVLVLVDATPWNYLNGGNSNTNTIPVQIIERIEVIKGPASSAWGSSLGGVINIITKRAGGSATPTGMVGVAAGERQTSDSRAEVSGQAGKLGYSLYGGHQESAGLLKDRDADSDTFFAKFDYPLPAANRLGLAVGYSEPHVDWGHLPAAALLSEGINRVLYTTATLDTIWRPELASHFGLYLKRHQFRQLNDEDGQFAPAGDLFQNNLSDEELLGGSGHLVWQHGHHTVVAGFEASRGESDLLIEAGAYRQSQGAAPLTARSGAEERQAVYVNDTISHGAWTLTPGLRYDDHSTSKAFVSPSLGLTWRPWSHTLFRATAARGFNSPNLGETTMGGLFWDSNPDLEPETITSFQVGAESTAGKYFWARLSLFQHGVRDALDEGQASTVTAGNTMTMNMGKERRRGGELEVKTAAWHDLSFLAGGSYAHRERFDGTPNREQYDATVGLAYDDGISWHGELVGTYYWEGLPASDATKGEYDNFLWDLNLRKAWLLANGRLRPELFCTVHNLFNGAQFGNTDYPSPRRWCEAGLRVKF